ncbi:unnamed protein product [Ceutorhynchus assimilis]|uniref:C2H2-type domain-containing protein n=1 Tax=Ceutorhynchus assimilis TaxID=467358 RepID=A0A9N9MEA1_9CUCU|nr:unnamed protein product [Ceutorhynchus assimilis]
MDFYFAFILETNNNSNDSIDTRVICLVSRKSPPEPAQSESTWSSIRASSALPPPPLRLLSPKEESQLSGPIYQDLNIPTKKPLEENTLELTAGPSRNLEQKTFECVDSMYECRNCSKAYRHKSSLCKHRTYECGGKERVFRCTDCNKAFSRKDTLKRHMKLRHDKHHVVL